MGMNMGAPAQFDDGEDLDLEERERIANVENERQERMR